MKTFQYVEHELKTIGDIILDEIFTEHARVMRIMDVDQGRTVDAAADLTDLVIQYHAFTKFMGSLKPRQSETKTATGRHPFPIELWMRSKEDLPLNLIPVSGDELRDYRERMARAE